MVLKGRSPGCLFPSKPMRCPSALGTSWRSASTGSTYPQRSKEFATPSEKLML